MRSLVVSGVLPLPADRGDRLREWDMLRALASMSEVDLALVVSRSVPGEELRLLSEHGIKTHVVRVDKVDGALNVLTSLVRGRPLGMSETRRVAQSLQRIGDAWDLVVAFQTKMAYYGSNLPAKIHVLEQTDSLTVYRESLRNRGYFLRWFSLRGISREERRWAERYDVTFLSAMTDVENFRQRMPSADIRLVENGALPSPKPVEWGPKDSLLFVGDLRYPPNLTAVRELATAWWPILRRAYPEIQLRIVGRLPNTWPRMRTMGVTWVGHVHDLYDEYARAIALINPVTFGAGSRRKVLEAWAVGLPVISTSRGLGGLRFTPDTAIVADTAEQAVAGLRELLNSRDTWSRMSKAGLDHVRHSYDSLRLWTEAFTALW